ncbi:hypothetical protein F4779DRAFT_638261 [Xylariaceae sp. FL0662B]|nr:hypothetical protein F4779DRAFT_638261 [Xylariaceae sp. FL0662B]
MPSFHDLPNELLLEITDHLSDEHLPSLVQLARTCSTLYNKLGGDSGEDLIAKDAKYHRAKKEDDHKKSFMYVHPDNKIRQASLTYVIKKSQPIEVVDRVLKVWSTIFPGALTGGSTQYNNTVVNPAQIAVYVNRLDILSRLSHYGWPVAEPYFEDRGWWQEARTWPGTCVPPYKRWQRHHSESYWELADGPNNPPYSLLSAAIARGKKDVTRWLVDNGAIVSKRHLEVAVITRSSSMLLTLLGRFINPPPSDGSLPDILQDVLFRSIEPNLAPNTEVIDVLANAGARLHVGGQNQLLYELTSGEQNNGALENARCLLTHQTRVPEINFFDPIQNIMVWGYPDYWIDLIKVIHPRFSHRVLPAQSSEPLEVSQRRGRDNLLCLAVTWGRYCPLTIEYLLDSGCEITSNIILWAIEGPEWHIGSFLSPKNFEKDFHPLDLFVARGMDVNSPLIIEYAPTRFTDNAMFKDNVPLRSRLMSSESPEDLIEPPINYALSRGCWRGALRLLYHDADIRLVSQATCNELVREWGYLIYLAYDKSIDSKTIISRLHRHFYRKLRIEPNQQGLDSLLASARDGTLTIDRSLFSSTDRRLFFRQLMAMLLLIVPPPNASG